jgi:Ser/Thr protein kinase RdoA (MazF antagonist)
MTLQSADSRLVFYMKRFTNPPPAAGREIRRCGSGARSLAGNELEWIRRLEAAGIACVVPVAFGQEVRGGRELRSVLITRAVEGSSLETWAATAHATDRAVVQMLIRQTADLARRLHGLGMVHRDLYLSHIYFDPVSQSLRLIDLQRVLRPVWRLSRWRVKDLAALNYSAPRPLISSADRLRWLREYLGTAKLGAAGKQWAYRVAGKTSRIARRDPRIARSGKT